MILSYVKRFFKYIIAVICLLVILILEIIHGVYVSGLDSQQFSKRWSQEESYSQVSCFFPVGEGLSEDSTRYLEHELGNKLASAESDSNSLGRKMIVAYSTEGKLSMYSDKGSADEVRCYAVSKDFFLFHPLKLRYGQYFNATDDTEDGIILDENVAWKLFGAVDVVGLTVTIGDMTYVIRGVVAADDGNFTEESGDQIPTVYVDYALYKHAMGYDVDEYRDYGYGSVTYDCIEMLIMNPVVGFGYNTMQEAMKSVGYEDGYELVENSKRFSFKQRFDRIHHFGTRSMRSNRIIYPCWENRARGYEDVSSVFLAIELLFAIYPILLFLWMIVQAWLKKDEVKHAIGKWFAQSLFPAIKKLYKDVYKTIQNRKTMVD